MAHPLFSKRKDISKFCCYCGSLFDLDATPAAGIFQTTDHLIPLSKGGTNQAYNKKNACKDCNFDKKDLHPRDYLQSVEARLENAYNKKTLSDISTLVDIYELEIKVLNTQYIIEYTKNMGKRLLKKNDSTKSYPTKKEKEEIHSDYLIEIQLLEKFG